MLIECAVSPLPYLSPCMCGSWGGSGKCVGRTWRIAGLNVTLWWAGWGQAGGRLQGGMMGWICDERDGEMSFSVGVLKKIKSSHCAEQNKHSRPRVQVFFFPLWLIHMQTLTQTSIYTRACLHTHAHTHAHALKKKKKKGVRVCIQTHTYLSISLFLNNI